MTDFFWFSDEQWARILPLLPTDVRGMKRVDDRRVLSAIVHALQRGGHWGDRSEHVYDPKRRLYNQFKRWADRGVWERIFADLAGDGAPSKLLINSSCITVHRTAGGAKGGP
jgi:transposase